MKCKGIVAVAKGDVRLMDVDVPEPGLHEVQVRMICTVISPGTERAHIMAMPNANQDFPYIPGYCCAGYVEEIGAEVTRFSKGDRVACYAVNIGHRELGNVPDYRVVHIPEGVSFLEAAFTSLGQTSLQAVRKCKIEIGESVLVLGLGLVGQLALQLAIVNGALPAIGVDFVESRLQTALLCGADYAINSKGKDLKTLLAPLTDGKGPCIVLDSTGAPDAVSGACSVAADFGRVSLLGCPRGLSQFNFYTDIQKNSVTLIGAHAVHSIPKEHSYPHHWTFIDDSDCYLRLVKSGRILTAPLVSDEIGRKDAQKMFQKVVSWAPDTMGIVIHWSER